MVSLALNITRYIIIMGVYPIVGTCGIIANIINIIVYIRNGFSESVNVSLLGLAISDLLSLIFTVLFIVFINPRYMDSPDVHWIPIDFTVLILVYPRLAIAQFSCVITVYITVERCLCFVIPLRVKTLLTPKRSALVVLTIFVLALPNLALPYTAAKLDWRWDPYFNRTAIGLVMTRHDSSELLWINNMINLSLQLGSLLALVFSNVALALSVNRQAKWRAQTTATTSQLGQTPAPSRNTPNSVTTNRNKRLAKMIQFLSMIHFVTYFFSTSFYVVSLVLPGFRLYGRYHYEYLSCGTSAVVAQTLNSSINIVFYYRMNKSFRNTFNKMFRKRVVGVGIFITEHNAMNNTTT
ncbi:chemosensory receptor B [Elysia marginata]|uniref:Chemosensory receptor B n=1 Tax=Elysia marginata TaxID=1093978 RepID=A0AAV4I1W2_9GAST|nr:chemosensory receptor B [Elysia marginata]